MLLTKLPTFAGESPDIVPRVVVTGKTSGTVAPGDMVESTDGVTWTKSDTGALTVGANDLNLKGVVVFDPAKGTTAYTAGDQISILIFGVVSVHCVNTAGITPGLLLQSGTSADVGRAKAFTWVSAASDTHEVMHKVWASCFGISLGTQNGAADSLVWMFMGVKF